LIEEEYKLSSPQLFTSILKKKRKKTTTVPYNTPINSLNLSLIQLFSRNEGTFN